MLRTHISFSKATRHLRIFFFMTVAAVLLAGCAGRNNPQAVVAQPVVPLVQKIEVAPMPTLIMINKTYKTKNAVPVRSAPDPEASVVTNLQTNEKFTAVAQVENSEWILVGKDNRSIGFVHQALVQPLSIKKKTK